MNAALSLLAKVDEVLALADHHQEECYRVTVTGAVVSESLVKCCIEIEELCNSLSIASPIFRVDEITLNEAEELGDYTAKKLCSWSIILSKDLILSKLTAGLDFTKSKDNLLYFSEVAALDWIKSLDPFATIESNLAPSLDKEIIIWLNNSSISFGGNKITVLPVGTTSLPDDIEHLHSLPERNEVTELVRINANEMLRIQPNFFILSWGDRSSKLAKNIMLLAVKSLVASISYELKKTEGIYTVTLKGTKSLIGKLDANCDVELVHLQNELIKTIRWVYSERSETRQQLIMDRLSLDMIPTNNFFAELNENISVALQQSQDSYAFVILDRKDAYHKEMRELLKDMRSQADMYASKVRDIVNNITRDMLGVFAFVGYSFLGKFDKSNLTELLNSHELSLLVRFLAGYLMLSCVMQLVIHLRDASLTSDESKKWLGVLQRYTSREENTESFLEPIRKRKKTLNVALFVAFCIYAALAWSIWHLPSIVLFLLSAS